MTNYRPVPKKTWEQRFRFLIPNATSVEPSLQLCHPDILDPDWTVFNRVTKKTVGRGKTPERAVDTAIHNSK